MSLPNRVLVNLALLAGSSILVLGLAEVGLRLFRPVQYLKPPRPPPPSERRDSLYRPSQAPPPSYELAPGKSGPFEGMEVRTNSLGMRGGEPAAADTRGLQRILALGDSFTFGFGIAEDQTYPRVLENLLNAASPGGEGRFEVLNLGVVGYTTRDEAAVLRTKGLPLNPRVVIIGYVLNDPEIDPRQSLHKYFDPPVWWRHFHVLRLFHLGWNRFRIWRWGDGDYLRYLHAPDRGKWRSVVEAFDAIARMTRRRDVRVVVAIFPLIPRREWRGYPYADLHRQVAGAARAKGFEVVDLLEVLSRHDPRDLRLTKEDDHPSRLGHRLVAEALRDRLLSGVLALPAPRQPER